MKNDTFEQDGEKEVQLKKAFQELNFSREVDSQDLAAFERPMEGESQHALWEEMKRVLDAFDNENSEHKSFEDE